MVDRSSLMLLLETRLLAIDIYMEYAVISCPVDYPKFSWFPGSAWEPMSRGSASAQTMEAEPPDMRYQALPGNEYKFVVRRQSPNFIVIHWQLLIESPPIF